MLMCGTGGDNTILYRKQLQLVQGREEKGRNLIYCMYEREGKLRKG